MQSGFVTFIKTCFAGSYSAGAKAPAEILPAFLIRLLYILALGLVNVTLYSQSIEFRLLDKVTGQPVPYAYAMIRDMNETVSQTKMADENGKISTQLEPPLVITIKSMGYKEIQDTIYITGEVNIQLSPEYYQLDRVVVTGQFKPQTVDKSIYKINVIDSRQIRMKASNDMGDLLKTELGYQYHSEGILGDFVRIRGLSGEYVKILIDGMPITGRVADRIDLGQLSLNNIDHIEVIEGPVSVVYGSNALAGAINLITAGISDQNLSASLNAYYESVGMYNFSAAITKRINNQSFSLNAARNFFAGWDDNDNSRFKIWKPKRQYLFNAGYQFKANKLSIRYNTDLLFEELRDQDSLSLATLYEKALDSYHFTKRWNNQLNIVREFRNNFSLNLQSGYSYYNKSKITYLNDLVNLKKTIADAPDMQDTTVFGMISTRAFITQTPVKNIEYQSGIDFNREYTFGKRTQGSKHITDVAGFLNVIYKPFPRLSVQPGIRFIYNSKFDAPVVYAMNIKYQTDRYAVYASYGKGFRAPSLKQLYLQFIDSNHEIIGNPDLKAETANDFSMSSSLMLPFGSNTLQFDMSIYYNSIRSAIQLAIDTLRPGWGTYFNIEGDQYRTKGVEAELKYNIYPGITINAGLATSGRMRLGSPHRFDYSTDVVSGLSYRNERNRYQISVNYKFTDNYLEFAGNYGSQGELTGIAERYINSYHMMDITFYKALLNDKLEINVGIKNLFNTTLVPSAGNLNFHGSSQNSVAAGYGRTYFIKLNFNIEKF